MRYRMRKIIVVRKAEKAEKAEKVEKAEKAEKVIVGITIKVLKLDHKK